MVCTDESICSEGMETQMYRMYLWTRWGKARVGWTERVALKYIHHGVYRQPVDNFGQDDITSTVWSTEEPISSRLFSGGCYSLSCPLFV